MPYKPGERLPGERASRLGHLDVLKSELIQQLCESFQDPDSPMTDAEVAWLLLPLSGEPLPLIFAVDGSLQVIESKSPPYKTLAFVKTALLRLDQTALAQIDKDSPHPFALRDLLADSALYHATVFPLRHVHIPGKSTYHAIREIIFDSVRDPSLQGEPMETLKWIAYEKWDGVPKSLPLFECPHCERQIATLPYDAEQGQCSACGGHLFLTDMLGFHQEMGEEAASDSVATAYMNIHETLLLFTGVRYFWENNRHALSNSLFLKDGPLSIRAQYSKLVAPIRRFLTFARDQGHLVHMVGQEKSGRFAEHLELIGRKAPERALFIPDDEYIKEEIQHRPNQGALYGKDTNYGAKLFVKIDAYHCLALSIPTGEFKANPWLSDFIGLERICATLPKILSYRYEGGLLPIELAHGVASLSTYPSAKILEMFAETTAKKL